MIQHYANVSPASAISRLRMDDSTGTTFVSPGIRPEWLSIPESERGHGANLSVLAPGYVTKDVRVGPLGGEPCLANVDLQKAEVPGIMVSGLWLYQNGQRWVARAASHYSLLSRIMAGDSLIHYEGANTYRVLLTHVNIANSIGRPPCHPDVFGTQQFFDGIRRMLSWAQDARKVIDACCIADNQLFGKDRAWLVNFIAQCREVFDEFSNVLPCIGNEPWNSVNGFDRTWFSDPGGRHVWSNASIQDADESQAGNDSWNSSQANHFRLIRPHTRRDFPKMLTHCMLSAPMFDYNHAVYVDEPMKFCDPIRGNYFDPELARIAGQTLRASCSGGCFHTPSGVYSVPLNGSEDACRSAFFSGLQN